MVIENNPIVDSNKYLDPSSIQNLEGNSIQNIEGTIENSSQKNNNHNIYNKIYSSPSSKSLYLQNSQLDPFSKQSEKLEEDSQFVKNDSYIIQNSDEFQNKINLLNSNQQVSFQSCFNNNEPDFENQLTNYINQQQLCFGKKSDELTFQRHQIENSQDISEQPLNVNGNEEMINSQLQNEYLFDELNILEKEKMTSFESQFGVKKDLQDEDVQELQKQKESKDLQIEIDMIQKQELRNNQENQDESLIQYDCSELIGNIGGQLSSINPKNNTGDDDYLININNIKQINNNNNNNKNTPTHPLTISPNILADIQNTNNSKFSDQNQLSKSLNSPVQPIKISESYLPHYFQQIKSENNSQELEIPLLIQNEIKVEMAPMSVIHSDQQYQQQQSSQWQSNIDLPLKLGTEVYNKYNVNCNQCNGQKLCSHFPPLSFNPQCNCSFSNNQQDNYEYEQQQNQQFQQEFEKQQQLVKGIRIKKQASNINPNINQIKNNKFYLNISNYSKKLSQFQLTEQQINMVDYAFLNGEEVLERIHIRARSENEYKDIIQLTHFMVETLTLDHDGRHFKSSEMEDNYLKSNTDFDLLKQKDKSQLSRVFPYQTSEYGLSLQQSAAKSKNPQKQEQYANINNLYNKQQEKITKINNNSIQSKIISSVDQKPKQLQLSIKLGDQLLVQSAIQQQNASVNSNNEAIFTNTLSSNTIYPIGNYNTKEQQLVQNYKNQIHLVQSNNQSIEEDEEYQDRNVIRNNEEESFEKSSNLTSEQWYCIQQLQKHKKKNVAKNIMTAFKNFIANPMKFGYSQQQITSAVSCYNKTKKIDESFDEMQSKFLKYIIKKKFNHYTIKLLIQHPNYGEVFEYFLKQLSDFWLEQSKVHDIEAHLAMINFLKEAYNDIEIINQLKKYDKRKY